MIPIKILEKELETTIRRLASVQEALEIEEEAVLQLKEDLGFNSLKMEELKIAIEKLKATEL